MPSIRLSALLLVAAGSFAQAQRSGLELAVGAAAPSSDLARYARPGAFIELCYAEAPLPSRWGLRMRFNLADYGPQRVTEGDALSRRSYERRAAAFTWGFEALTPALAADGPRLRGILGIGLEAWRLTEIETTHLAGGTSPDQRLDNGYGIYWGNQATLGVRLEITSRTRAELRLEAAKMYFLGLLKDRAFNAPVRLTGSVGWRF